ncbi:MAG TPA: acyl-CoA dehydrogenase family protein [Polyangiaceae bacterium]|nr:acyl-CoA dehydrogenase family protein [Polyangiaceae bacterium]
MSLPPPSAPARPGLSTDDLGFLFRDEHRELAAKVRQAIARVTELEESGAVSRQLPDESGKVERAIVLEFGARGFLQSFAPKAGAVDLRSICLVREGLAWASGAADSLFAVQGLGTYPIHAFGSAEQKSRLLPGAVAGSAVAAFALTEPEAGTDVASLQTVAKKDDGDPALWRLTGTKTFISNAPIADQMVVFANADPPARRKGITAFVVQRDAPGLTVQGPIAMMADHSIGTLHLDRTMVRDADRLGDVGAGFDIAMSTLDTFRVSVGAAACGMARRALDEALHRAVWRQQFGKSIGEFQQIQAYLADSVAELDAARLLVFRAALLKDEGAASITEEAAIAKMYATEAAQRIIDRCLQIHGGLGVVRGIAVERLYREIRALRIYEGTTEIQRVVIATRRLERERRRQSKTEAR